MLRRFAPSFLVTALFTAMAIETLGATEQNLFEWTAVAPVVLSATVMGEEGKFTVVHVEEVFRGDVKPATRVRIDIKEANRTRSRNADPKGLKLALGKDYVLLLEESMSKSGGKEISTFRLVRGVRGARMLPAEGAAVIVNALPEFVRIQDQKSEAVTWSSFSMMLEENNPVLLEVSLDQFLKFRRGDPDLVYTLLPLLGHPRADLREKTTRLIHQIIEYFPVEEIPDETTVRTELVALARRDPAVPVRISATEALGGFPDESVKVVLEEIADSDPEQDVRYVAEKLLYDRRLRARHGSN